MPLVVLAFDKFRGTVSAAELGESGAKAAESCGWRWRSIPLADGGEGSVDCIGGANRVARVEGPLGHPVDAPWRIAGETAYIEMADASGLVIAGGPDQNDALAASTRGTGQLIRAALDEGVDRVVVFLGGSATTDGGAGAVDVIRDHPRLAEVELVAAADVETHFLEAARVFGPQKGADAALVEVLTDRLEAIAWDYEERFAVDVRSLPGAGAAGGLAGGLVALGATITSGFDVVAHETGFFEAIGDADLVVTGEGRLDAASFEGKVVGGVTGAAMQKTVPVLAIVGTASGEYVAPPQCEVVVLTDRFDTERALAEPGSLVQLILEERLCR